MIATKPPKAKTCWACKSKFTPARTMQRVCSPLCGLELARNNRVKAERLEKAQERKETKAKLDKLKTNAQRANEAQTVVNKYVRLRDAKLGCVSCDRPASWDGQWHASHFRSVGAASGLRFHLWNIHKACSICNHHLSGNIAAYEPRLVDRIGRDRVEWLRNQNAVKHSDAAYLERMKKVFTKKAKRMESRV